MHNGQKQLIKSESMQKSTKIADSWQGSKNQNRSSFADWYTLVSLQTLCSFFFEGSIRFREKRRKSFQAPQAISQAKNRASSETQGQLVGSIKCSWRKFTIRSRRAPGHLLLPNQFQKRLNCPLLIGQKTFFLANQRRGAAG